MKAAAVLDLPGLLTTAELAVLLKVNRSTVSRWRSVGAYVSGRTFDTRRDAQAWLAREQAALAGGVDPRAGRSTCRTLSECCYWMVELRGLEPLTFSLRRLRQAEGCVRGGRLSVHCVPPENGRDVCGGTHGAHGRTDNRALPSRARPRHAVPLDNAVRRGVNGNRN
jgi:hypothetical protein